MVVARLASTVPEKRMGSGAPAGAWVTGAAAESA
jgi:hypothetical protein